MENFEKLKDNLPEIAKIVTTFPEALQEKVYDDLISELRGTKRIATVTESNQGKSTPLIQNRIDDLSAVATLTKDGKYHISIRDLKAVNAKDALKRLVYVIIQSYTKLTNSSSVSRKGIINPELVKWRLADANCRGYIAADKGIIKDGDELSLDVHAQSEADQFISEINDPEKTGSWKPGPSKKVRRTKNGSESVDDQIQETLSIVGDVSKNLLVSSSEKPQSHTLGEVNNTSTIAQIINAQTEMDLILAAAIKFVLVDGKDTFNREEILREMQAAPSYYRASYLNNATKYLKKLVRSGKLRENAPDIYALSAETKKELRQKLGLE